jgi:hypothetical protein
VDRIIKKKIAHRASVWDVRVVLAVVFDFHFVHMTCFERREEKNSEGSKCVVLFSTVTVEYSTY